MPEGTRHPEQGDGATAYRQTAAAAEVMVSLPLGDIDQLSPLAVLLMAMVARWKAGDVSGAVAFAARAAPYCHPRLAQTDLTVKRDYAAKSEAELLAEAGALEQRLLSHEAPAH